MISICQAFQWKLLPLYTKYFVIFFLLLLKKPLNFGQIVIIWPSTFSIPTIFLRHLKLTIVMYYRFFKIKRFIILTPSFCNLRHYVRYLYYKCMPFCHQVPFLSFRDKAMTKRDIRRLPRGAQVYVSMMCNDFSRRSIFSTRTTMAHTQWNFSLS